MWVGTARGSKAPGDGEPVRRHTRVLFSVPIALHHLVAGGIRTSRGVSLDISESGIGALVEGALHVGDAVSIDINLPAAKLRAVAIVRHTSSVRSGFEFLGLGSDERERIAQVAAPLKQQPSPTPVLTRAG